MQEFMKQKLVFAILAGLLCLCTVIVCYKVKLDFRPGVEGLFVLEGEQGAWLELTDDLVPEDAGRLIWAKPLYPLQSMVTYSSSNTPGKPHFDFKWDAAYGRGYIKTSWPDRTKLVINLGRFKDSNGKYPHGLFIGGGIPPSDPDYQALNQDATGMAYFDGRRWYHIWCNSNEGLVSPAQPFLPSFPSDWIYRGSWLRENNGRDVTIESRHSMKLNNIPLDMNRFLFYTAGNRYAVLEIELINRGSRPVPFQYQYGDEPWIGDFGSSAGDVGWAGSELITSERILDLNRYCYFGMFDYGNELAGERHNFTGVANFIEWPKEERPTRAYVSNYSGGVSNPDKAVPLTHRYNRFIGVTYGPGVLEPGKPFHITLAIGMADAQPMTGMPVKPVTELNP